MKTILEPARETPVASECDVLVCGGGPAGFAAAVAAARAGADTLLLEQSNCLGGMSTAGMMSHWSGCDSSPIGLEITDRMRRYGALPPGWREDRRWCCSHEALKEAMFEIAAEAGVRVQLHTWVAGAVVEGGAAKGAITESKSGREAVLAKVSVDATGDGDLAARAGAAFDLGREVDGACQPATLMFLLGGVDTERAILPPSFESLVQVPKGEIQALGKARLPAPAGHVLLYPTRLPGCVCVNMTNAVGVDATDARSVTRAEIECRAQIEPIVAFLREFAPGYEKCYALASAQNVGIRESRHFRGLYTLTAEDIVAGRSFDDWIAVRNWFNFDNEDYYVYVYYPKGADFNDVMIDTSAGDVDIEKGFNCNKISFDLSAGDVKINNVNGELDVDMSAGDFEATNCKFGRSVFDLSAGDVELTNCTVAGGELDMSAGDFDAKALTLTDSFDIDMSAGSATIEFVDGQKIGYDLDLSAGSAKINGEKRGDEFTMKDGYDIVLTADRMTHFS